MAKPAPKALVLPAALLAVLAAGRTPAATFGFLPDTLAIILKILKYKYAQPDANSRREPRAKGEKTNNSSKQHR